VVTASQQAEAEWIQMLLLDEGVPSTLRRSAGFDVPEMMAAGRRDVLVPESGLEIARQVLLDSDIDPVSPAQVAGPAPARLLAGIVAALIFFAVVTLVLSVAIK
jgi:hypothetical protein